ncbi:MAG: CBS domain-containing protein [Halobacteriaceae archaeon]
MDVAESPDGGKTPLVSDYMTTDVVTVEPGDSVEVVAERMSQSRSHNGFPVCEGQRVVGFVTARDLLGVESETPVEAVMSEDLLVAHPEMKVNDAARVILRSGIQKLPVVDDDGDLVGIISNTDVVRSQIERATPEKVGRLRRTLESIHGVETREERRSVALADLVPTQSEVYADELEGRSYELQRGLAEPLVTIRAGPDGKLLLADGHHRALAARRLDMADIDAYVIVIAEPIQLGMERTAEREGLSSIDDVEVVDYARHPLVESTKRLQ